MPIFVYECGKCKKIIKIFSHKDQICPKCGNNCLKRVRHTPLSNRNTEGTKTDYRGTECTVGIKEDIQKRNKRHTNETLKETIDKFGTKIAKEQGWITEDGKIRTDWEDF